MNDIDKKLIGPGYAFLLVLLIGMGFIGLLIVLDYIPRGIAPRLRKGVTFRTRDIIEQEKMKVKNKSRGKRHVPGHCPRAGCTSKEFDLDSSGDYDEWTCRKCSMCWMVIMYGRKTK